MTDFNPLNIWFFEKFYCRFAAEKYDAKDFKNNFQHLTNTAIAKFSTEFETCEIEGALWLNTQLEKYLKVSLCAGRF